MNTEQLIAQLSSEPVRKRALQSPRTLATRAGGVLLGYGVAVQCFLGLRPDLATELARPLFAGELALLGLIAVTSLLAALLRMYPDNYQHSHIARWPLRFAAMFAVLMVAQLASAAAGDAPLPEGLECAVCIASVAFLPALALLMLLRRGASTAPQSAGMYAALAASAVGCFTLRLSEVTDSIPHLIGWHYVPTLAFACLGALVGRVALKW